MKKLEMKPESLENVCIHSILKNTKGITLIALVITIIVLIILAGVAINTLTGDNSIILFSYDEMIKFSNSKGFLLATI